VASPSVLVRFMADMKNLTQGVQSSEGNTKSLTGTMTKLGAAIGATFVAKKVVDFAKDSINAAKDLNANMSRSKTIFGDAASGVEDWSKTSSKSLRMSQADALGAANTIGKTLVGSFGMSGKAAASMSEDVVKTAKDMAVFNRIPMDQALTAIQKGLTGSTRGLKDMGVAISQSDIEMKAVQMGLAKTTVDMSKVQSASLAAQKAQLTYNDAVAKHGKDSTQAQKAMLGLEGAQNKVKQAMSSGKTTLDGAAKAQATFALIQEKASYQMGATERSSKSAAAQQEVLSASWKNAQAQVGQALLPAVTKFSQVMTSTLVPVIKVAADIFSRYGAIIIPLVAVFAGLVAVTKAVSLAQDVMAIKTMAVAVAQGVAQVATTIWTAAQWLLNVAMTANPIGLIIAAIVALIAIIVVIATKTTFFQTVWTAMSSAITNAWKAATSFIINAAQTVFNWIARNWPLLLGILTGPVGLAVALIIKNFSTIQGFLNTVFGWFAALPGRIGGALASLAGVVAGAAASAGSAFLRGITGAFDSVLGFVASIPGRIGSLLHIDLFAAGREIIASLARGIESAAGGVLQKAADIAGKIKGLLPFSPAKWGPLHDYPPEKGGANIIKLMAQGMSSQATNLAGVASGLVTPLGGPTGGGGTIPVAAGAGGPALVIQNATFTDNADVDLLMRKATWAARTRSA
jgi:hypothetical protein